MNNGFWSMRGSNLPGAFLAALTAQALTWFVLYPLAGYNDITLLIAHLAFLTLGIGLISAFRLDWKQSGWGEGISSGQWQGSL